MPNFVWVACTARLIIATYKYAHKHICIHTHTYVQNNLYKSGSQKSWLFSRLAGTTSPYAACRIQNTILTDTLLAGGQHNKTVVVALLLLFAAWLLAFAIDSKSY